MAEKNISEVKNLGKLLLQNLEIPEYQRYYKWENEQVANLLNDMWNNQKQEKNVPCLIGTVILHEEDDKDKKNDWNGGKDKYVYHIVDGQQRLITLTMILYALGYKDTSMNRLLERSFLVDTDTVKTNYDCIKNWLDKYDVDKENFKNYILDKATFVIITTTDVDEAFVFFDSQNSRGKSLERKDLLKAHHLRYVVNDDVVATAYAKEWETLDKKGKLTYLIDVILGRTRQRIRKEEAKSIDVLKEFKAQRVSRKVDSFYTLSRYHQPPVFDSWRYDGELELVFRNIDAWQGTKRLKFLSDSKKFLPLQLMQPLEGGEQFFWYVQKYDVLLNEELFNEKFESKVLPKIVVDIYKVINDAANRNVGMRYIREIFEAALLFYYDKFGTDDIEKFGLWLEHGLSYLRYKHSALQYATVRKYIIDFFNPFAIINEAAFPENCIYHIDDFVRGKYKDKNINCEKGIRQWYHGEISTVVLDNKELFENAALTDKNRFEIWTQK
jgi:hypothetical protein